MKEGEKRCQRMVFLLLSFCSQLSCLVFNCKSDNDRGLMFSPRKEPYLRI